MSKVQEFAPKWSDKMVEIWKDRLRLQGAINTGRLYHSIRATGLTASETSLSAEFRFLLYGIFVEYGRRNGKRGQTDARHWFRRSWEVSTRVAVDTVQEAVGDKFVEAFRVIE